MPRKSTKVVEYEVSSGNVYADLGFADSAEMLAKARIVAQIGRIIQAHKLTQAKAGELMNIDQPKVSTIARTLPRLLSGTAHRFSDQARHGCRDRSAPQSQETASRRLSVSYLRLNDRVG